MTPADDATVFVIDDDARMRAATQLLLKSASLHAETFITPQDFLRRKLPEGPGGLVLDVGLPGMRGLAVQRRLTKVGVQIPVIFIGRSRGHSHDGQSHASKMVELW
ncbi:MAG TPA: response regulator [Terriglobales bacterium]|nr:response regulator [Terriglobales bacterium]